MHVDIPTRAEIESLIAVEAPGCVSLYVPSSPLTQEAQQARIVLRNLSAQAAPAAEVADALDDLAEDDEFWEHQANSLAVFAAPGRVRTFRLANALSEAVRVGDRFDVKPLLRAVTFPNAAFVLALAQGSVRLLEVAASMPTSDVRVPGMPSDAASAAGKASIADRSPSGRIQGSEGQKLRMTQYARKVDAALRDVLAGRHLPLILAAAPPLDTIFRSVCTYPRLADEGIQGNPEGEPDDVLTAHARAVLDRIYAAELRGVHDLFDERGAQGRAASEISDVARAATIGAVDTLIVDIDVHLPGAIDEAGAIEHDGDAEAPGITDELVRRTLQHSGRVLAVRSEDVPGGGAAAAVLRYPA
jgi:hypothetical protein